MHLSVLPMTAERHDSLGRSTLNVNMTLVQHQNRPRHTRLLPSAPFAPSTACVCPRATNLTRSRTALIRKGERAVLLSA